MTTNIPPLTIPSPRKKLVRSAILSVVVAFAFMMGTLIAGPSIATSSPTAGAVIGVQAAEAAGMPSWQYRTSRCTHVKTYRFGLTEWWQRQCNVDFHWYAEIYSGQKDRRMWVSSWNRNAATGYTYNYRENIWMK